MAAVLLGLAGHETHIGHRAHGGRVQSPVGAAVIDDGLVDPGVGGVRDDGERVRGLAVRPPQVAAGPDHGGHGGVDDDVTGHVQVRDAAVGVHHGQARSGGQLGLDGSADLLTPGQRVQARQDRGQPVLGPQTRLGQDPPVGGEDPRQGGAHRVTEDDRVGDLHHRGLEVHRQQQVLVLGGGHLPGEELIQGGGTHEGGVHDLPGGHWQRLPQDDRLAAVGRAQADLQGAGLGHDDAALIAPEVARSHRGHAGARLGRPGPHRVRVGAGIGLDGRRGAPVRVALTQDGVDGAALDGVVGGARLPLGGRGRGVGVVGDLVAQGLELGDGGLELGQGGGDIGQLDDRGRWGLGELTQTGQVVVGQGEGCQDASRQRDVRGAHAHARPLGEAAHDRQEGVGRQHRGLIGPGVDDVGLGGLLRLG